VLVLIQFHKQLEGIPLAAFLQTLAFDKVLASSKLKGGNYESARTQVVTGANESVGCPSTFPGEKCKDRTVTCVRIDETPSMIVIQTGDWKGFPAYFREI